FVLHLRVVIFHRPFTAVLIFFFLHDTTTTEIYTLSLHDALPIYPATGKLNLAHPEIVHDLDHHDAPISAPGLLVAALSARRDAKDRKSTRLNSSHRTISYAVFCLKKKKKKIFRQIASTVIRI